MRFASRFTTAIALLIPLAGASCSSEPKTFPGQPVPAALSDMQAATLAKAYVTQNSVPTTGMMVDQERQSNSWWFYYQTAFDAAASPPSLSYLVRVQDDGKVDHLR